MGKQSDPWYAGGLGFTCTRCGRCCTGEPGFVWVNEKEVAAIARKRGETVEFVLQRFTQNSHRGATLREQGNGDCVFYDQAEGCTIYEVRPRQCRTWPFWESTAATPEAWEKTKKICPGAGQGDLISAEEITRRMKIIKI